MHQLRSPSSHVFPNMFPVASHFYSMSFAKILAFEVPFIARLKKRLHNVLFWESILLV